MKTPLFLTKPPGFTHNPVISHTIKPAQPIPFNLWNEVIRAQVNGEDAEEIALVKMSPLEIAKRNT